MHPSTRLGVLCVFPHLYGYEKVRRESCWVCSSVYVHTCISSSVAANNICFKRSCQAVRLNQQNLRGDGALFWVCSF